MVSSPRYVEVGRAGPMKAEGIAGMPTRFVATSMVKRWRSPRLRCGRCPELDAVLGDAILGEMEENGCGSIVGT